MNWKEIILWIEYNILGLPKDRGIKVRCPYCMKYLFIIKSSKGFIGIGFKPNPKESERR